MNNAKRELKRGEEMAKGFIGKVEKNIDKRLKFLSNLQGKPTLDELMYNSYLSQKNCRRYKEIKAPESILKVMQDRHHKHLKKVRARLAEIRRAVNA